MKDDASGTQDWNEELASAGPEELRRGYSYDPDSGIYRCLLCEEVTEQGTIYPSDGEQGLYWDAERRMKEHTAGIHGSMLQHLISLDKKYTGLSPLQSRLLSMFREGLSDVEIVKRVGGSASTIRNHRFTLREKEKQARLFLAIMDGLRQEEKKRSAEPRAISRGRGSDEPVSPEEELRELFPQGLEGPLRTWPRKESRRIRIAQALGRRLQPGRRYSEPEVNAILTEAWPDYAVLRRYMIEYGIMERLDDGSAYWLAESGPEDEAGSRQPGTRELRRETARSYEMTPPVMGVFRVLHEDSGRMWIGSSRNIQGMFNRTRFELDHGVHKSRALQADWQQQGADPFRFEVLEELPRREDGEQDVRRELAALEAKWLQELRPYGERGYHEPPEPK